MKYNEVLVTVYGCVCDCDVANKWVSLFSVEYFLCFKGNCEQALTDGLILSLVSIHHYRFTSSFRIEPDTPLLSVANPIFTKWGCGRDKSSDPISAFLKQEVHFQNIEHKANGCQQPGFHSFYHGKIWNTLYLLQMLCWTVWITTLYIFCCPTRGLFVGMSIQNHAPIRFLIYSIWNDSFTVSRLWPWTSLIWNCLKKYSCKVV